MLKQHVTILEMNGKLGVLAIASDEKAAVVGNYTEGKLDKYTEVYLPKEDGTLTISDAYKAYRSAIEKSYDRGSKLIYQGIPNNPNYG